MRPNRALTLLIVTTIWFGGGCVLQRDVELGGLGSSNPASGHLNADGDGALLGRHALQAQVGSGNGRVCVGGACTQLQATGGVGPSAGSCLQGDGAGCAARLDVRSAREDGTEGTSLPPGASLALPSPLVRDVRRVLVVRNVAMTTQAAALHVLAVVVEERCGSAPCSGPSGVRCSRGPKKLPCGAAQAVRLVPNETAGMHNHQVEIQRVAAVNDKRQVIVHILTSGDPRWATTPWYGVLKPRNGQPKLIALQALVAMPWRGPLTTTTTVVTFANAGDATAEVYGVRLEGQRGFSYRLEGDSIWHKSTGTLAAPVLVERQRSLNVQVRFTPEDSAKKYANLAVLSDAMGAQSTNAATVNLIGNGAAPCIRIAPAKPLKFGLLQVGGCAERKLEVRSCGTGTLALTGLKITAAATFMGLTAKLSSLSAESGSDGSGTSNGLGNAAGLPKATPTVLIPPGGSRKLSVRYCPTKLGVLLANVTVIADGLPPHAVQVSATSVSSLCPVAVATLAEGAAVLPLTPLHLSGANSTAAVAGALTYHWEVTQPDGSYRSLTPASSHISPTFVPAVSGQYSFCLTVRDAAGHPSCQSNCRTVEVRSDAGLHVELLWTTPGDPDETDTGPGAGSDLDLHVTHPMGSGPDLDCDGAGDPWFHGTYDAYWGNVSPAWNAVNPNVDDDPNLDLDDTDGGGPELLSIMEPTMKNLAFNAQGYGIGVHYWNDHGFGVATASIRIFVAGTLAAVLGPVTLTPLDLWTVARVSFTSISTSGPSTATGSAVGQVIPCWQNTPPCSGGKPWLLSGVSCITSCYLPVNPPAGSHAPACVTSP